jgi:tripartite ATP-independent transporter DctP family solute receptor
VKKRIIACALAAAVLVGAGTQAAQAAPRIISAVASSALGGPQQLSIGAFQSEIKTRMGERLVVDGRSGTTLGSENALLAAARSGSVDIAILTGPVVSIAVPEFGVFDMPFVFRDWAHVKAVSEGPLAEQIAPKFAAKGLVLLAIGEQGFRNITNSKRPIRTPADLVGLKIRVLPNEIYQMTFRALGAEVVPMEFPLVYAALKDARIDGQENPISTVVGSSLQQVQKHMSMTRHFFAPIAVVMNREMFEAFEPADRKVLIEAARAAVERVRSSTSGNDANGLEKLKQDGMQVIETVDRQPFIDAVKTLEPEFEKRFGKELLAAIKAAR